ncbi:MAG: hypothetical protein ACXWID_09980 [Pyrinomonadaceae bacterium]
MANTCPQIYIQTVFAVDGRLSLIRAEFKEELYKYITGIVRNKIRSGHSQLNTNIRYIQNQEQHHRRRTFRDEYLTWLKKFEVPFDERYIFKFGD